MLKACTAIFLSLLLMGCQTATYKIELPASGYVVVRERSGFRTLTEHDKTGKIRHKIEVVGSDPRQQKVSIFDASGANVTSTEFDGNVDRGSSSEGYRSRVSWDRSGETRTWFAGKRILYKEVLARDASGKLKTRQVFGPDRVVLKAR